MGTDIQSIQMTYQSLARGNYAMLDQLKLGYGGTKEELKRLLVNAEKLTGIKYDPSNFADVIQAIHVVQEDMAITGTTALEAATTIEGSTSMMKAAWTNWLVGLGNTEADIGQLTDQLVDTVIVAASNVIPRIGIILSTLVDTIASKAPEIAQKLKDGLIALLPDSVREPVENAINTIVEVFGRIATILEPIISTIQTILGGLFESLGSLGSTWSVTIEPAFALAETYFQAVADVMQHLADQASAVLMPAIEALAPTVASLLEAIQPWIEPLTNVANLVGNILVAAITAVIDIINFLIQVITAVLNAFMDFSYFLEGQPSVFGDFVNQIGAWFSQLPGMIGGFLQSVIASIVAWASDMLNQAVTAGTNFLNGVVQTFNDVVSWFTGLPGMILGALGDLGGLLWNAGSSIIDGLLGGLQEAWGGVAGWFADITSAIPDLKGPAPVDAKLLVNNGKLIMQGLGRGLDDGWSGIEQQLKGYTNSIPVTFDESGTARALTQGMMQRFDAYKVRQMVALDSDSSKALGNVSGIISNRFDDIKSLASRPVVLNVNGRELAYTTQADYDSVLGRRQNIEIRGFARA